jgi:hypothetical protein
VVDSPFKLGRNPRTFDPNIPHLSTIPGAKKLPPPPASVNYTTGMPEAPNKFGTMLNDRLGDCTCAAFYHARQVWTFHSTGKTETAPNADVVLLYEKACGYKRDGSEGPGGVEQKVLTYIFRHGAPIGNAGPPVDKILGFVEVPHTNIDDVKRTIHNCGVAYIGLNLPKNILPPGAQPPKTWTVVPGAGNAGGHAVVLPGYDEEGAIVISWGATYKMTWDFFRTYVDEVYAITDAAWSKSAFARKHGLILPGGLSESALVQHMQAL